LRLEHHHIDELVTKIKALEEELETQLHQEYEQLSCEISKKHSKIYASYQKDREGLLHYWAKSPFLHLVSVPFIWSLLIPAVILDLFVTVYQGVCFPIYKITKVKRREYILIDRHHLGYLNAIEKLNCLYCSYFNGLMGYVTEIAARTEQYWCPIAHAKRVKSLHSHYHVFFQYGDSKGYRQGLDKLRKRLQEEEKSPSKT
jgi:hypothetical protein